MSCFDKVFVVFVETFRQPKLDKQSAFFYPVLPDKRLKCSSADVVKKVQSSPSVDNKLAGVQHGLLTPKQDVNVVFQGNFVEIDQQLDNMRILVPCFTYKRSLCTSLLAIEDKVYLRQKRPSAVHVLSSMCPAVWYSRIARWPLLVPVLQLHGATKDPPPVLIGNSAKYTCKKLLRYGGCTCVYTCKVENYCGESPEDLYLLKMIGNVDKRRVEKMAYDMVESECDGISPFLMTRQYSLQAVFDGVVLETTITEYPRGGYLDKLLLGAGHGLSLLALQILGAQLCDAVGFLHQKPGLLHLDAKPANLLLTEEGALKLCDLSSARPLRQLSASEREHWKEKRARVHDVHLPPHMYSRPLTPAVDWFSVGATLYWLATLKWPYTVSSTSRPGDLQVVMMKGAEHVDFRMFSLPKNIDKMERDLSDLFVSLVTSLLSPLESVRLQQVDKVLGHDFFMSNGVLAGLVQSVEQLRVRLRSMSVPLPLLPFVQGRDECTAKLRPCSCLHQPDNTRDSVLTR